MNKKYLQDNPTLFATILFVLLFLLIQSSKPSFLYKKDGSIREFGIGYKNKTILPVWLLSIILGILCYLIVLWYIKMII